ncbi:hypothetical protein [Pelosinus sp. UFO1]|uniref:hypothetical protein n=1 Tax=Pelosinus sp. UFO1 TaxID=484770 RepID=UPI0004D12B45|nr:hypothetical protein [Pelosinus sp. UFO1]AIF50741.1 hypothetical protein UFO1_1186 [Pelosinus sp. UFO1]
MKKTFVAALVGMNMMAAGIASANQIIPEINPIKPGIETVTTSNGKNGSQYAMIDHNPTIYDKQVVGVHTVEGWVKNNVVHTTIDGVAAYSHPINADLETVVMNNSSKNGTQYAVTDHNPANYNKRVVGGHIVESSVKDDVVNTAIDGVITNSYHINADLETVMISNSNNGSQYAVIDHNPTNYNKRIVSGHSVESWSKNDVAHTIVDGVAMKGDE